MIYTRFNVIGASTYAFRLSPYRPRSNHHRNKPQSSLATFPPSLSGDDSETARAENISWSPPCLHPQARAIITPRPPPVREKKLQQQCCKRWPAPPLTPPSLPTYYNSINSACRKPCATSVSPSPPTPPPFHGHLLPSPVPSLLHPDYSWLRRPYVWYQAWGSPPVPVRPVLSNQAPRPNRLSRPLLSGNIRYILSSYRSSNEDYSHDQSIITYT